MLTPRDEAELAECIAAHRGPLEVVGAGSKRAIGRPAAAEVLSVAALEGIVDYRPEELVLTARAATPLITVQDALLERGQRLAFEPPDLGPLLGVSTPPTLGGVLAANLAGSRRVSAGAARDHFLGFRAVSGRGERFKAGGKVVKNVTGYDLPKLLAGSWGTLAVLTEVTVRAVPAPECERTLLLPAETVEDAVATMTRALGSQHEVSAAAFDPREALLALRVEGFAPSVAARCEGLLAMLQPAGRNSLADADSRVLWAAYGRALMLLEHPVLWRISVPPTESAALVRALDARDYFMDWAGGLVWLAADGVDEPRVRGAVRSGHATLIKAPAAERARVPSFQPPSPVIAALAARVKAAFDADGKLNPGRMS